MTPTDIVYQSPESNQDNPLMPQVTETTTGSTASSKKFKFPTDPKLRALFVLGGIIAILIPLSLVSVILRKKPVTTYKATPTSTILPSPTPTSAIAIPNDLQFKLDQISKLSISPDTIAAPQIDEKVGIKDD